MSSYHIHTSEDPWQVPETYHDHVADNVAINVHLNVNDASHVQEVDSADSSPPLVLFGEQSLSPDHPQHIHIADNVLAIQPVIADDGFMLPVSDLVQIQIVLSPHNASHVLISTFQPIFAFSQDRYNDLATPVEQSVDVYNNERTTFVSSIALYGEYNKILHNSESSYHLLPQVLAQSIDGFNIIDGTIVKDFDESLYDLDLNHKVREQSYDYWILSSDTVVQDSDVTFKLNGEDLVPSSISSIHIYCGVDQFCMSVDINLSDISVFNKCTYRSILEVSTGFDTFVFIIDNRKRNRRNGELSMTVTGTSLTADLGAPYANQLTKIFNSDLVSNIAKDLADTFTLEWNTVDWTMPANTLSVVDQTPIEIIKLLASTVGAVVLTTPDNILKVEPMYPINPSSWESSSAELVISDDDDIIEQDEVDEIRPGYNAVLLSNQKVIENENVTIDEEDVSGTVKRLKVYSVPFNNSLVLKTSGGPTISIDFLGIEIEAITETIEFINGVARVSKSVYDIISYEWILQSLGTLTFSEDGEVTATVDSHSLLEITYNTKYYLYEVKSPVIEKVQFYVE